MLSNFTNDEFEEFLKRSSDALRLRPSDKVWKGIAKKLNDRRRRIGFATGTFLLITSLLGYFVVQNNDNVQPVASASSEVSDANEYTPAKPSQKFSNNRIATEEKKVASPDKEKPDGAIIKALYPDRITTESNNVAVVKQPLALTEPLPEETFFATPFADSDPEIQTEQSVEKATENSTTLPEKLLTIESITNAYKRLAKKSKLSFQVFFTPTISYRKLTENKSYLRSVPPQSNVGINYAALYNVNDAVTHQPDIGLELGATAKYPIGKNLKLKGGLQFNVSRYAIKAFNYTTEYATIALNSGSGVAYTGSRSNHRNFGGGKTDWLQNMYFQVSMPVGAEIKLAGNDNTSFGIATTIQPNYVLGDRAYLLSTDYKNYTEAPWLMRRWNVATSVETFVSYSTGKMRWQVGPQVRYQLLSSFVTEYPVKENLFDFGLKIGISLNGDNKGPENNK